MIINNQSHVPPSNNEVDYITLDFELNDIDYYLATGVCNSLGGDITFCNNSNIAFINVFQTLIVCYMTTNASFENLYFNFFWNNENDDFHYLINSNNDGSYSLTLTVPNGDQAIYGSQTLSIEGNSLIHTTMSYDVETKSIEFTDNITNSKLHSISIYNSLGKQIITKEDVFINDLSINLSFFKMDYTL